MIAVTALHLPPAPKMGRVEGAEPHWIEFVGIDVIFSPGVFACLLKISYLCGRF